MWAVSSSLTASVPVSFCWVNDHNLCDKPFILRGWHLDFYISNSAILSWVDIDDSSDGPVFTNRVGIFHDDYVIHSHSALFSILLLSGDQRREHVSGPTSPEGVHYHLYEFDSMPWVPGFSERSLWHHWGGSSKEHVVGSQIRAVIRVVRNSTNGVLIHQVSHFQ